MTFAPPKVSPKIEKGDLSAERLAKYLKAEAVAVDTETLGLQPLRDRLCVVQLCDRAMNATLVQIPQHTTSAPRLKELFEAKAVLKVFHFARFDVAALRHALGIKVDPLYCTRTASKLVRTYTDRHGLKDVAAEFLDVEMEKQTRHSDWGAEKLSKEQVKYAISDVTMLLPIMDGLQARLLREGRAQLADECFKAIPTIAQLDLLSFENLFEH
jgi:ribonuclease D